MTPGDALADLFSRVAAAKDATVLLSTEELREWPAEAVMAMKAQKLIVKARPAASVVCPGCEEQCAMPVHTRLAGAPNSASFVVCDKRDDISTVPVPKSHLEQWRTSGAAIAGVLSGLLGLRQPAATTDAPSDLWQIGMLKGANRAQMLCLKTEGDLLLVVGSRVVPLCEFIDHRHGAFTPDAGAIRNLVDKSNTADPHYTPSNAKREARKKNTLEMYKTWQREYRALKKKRPEMSDVWYSRQIAMKDVSKRRDAETIRKHMKRGSTHV